MPLQTIRGGIFVFWGVQLVDVVGCEEGFSAFVVENCGVFEFSRVRHGIMALRKFDPFWIDMFFGGMLNLLVSILLNGHLDRRLYTVFNFYTEKKEPPVS